MLLLLKPRGIIRRVRQIGVPMTVPVAAFLGTAVPPAGETIAAAAGKEAEGAVEGEEGEEDGEEDADDGGVSKVFFFSMYAWF